MTFEEWLRKKNSLAGEVQEGLGLPEEPAETDEEAPGKPKKKRSFTDWLAEKGQAPTPLGTPSGKTLPWGSPQRGPRIPGWPEELQTPLSPQTFQKVVPPELQAQIEEERARRISPEFVPPAEQRAMEARIKAIEAGETPARVAQAVAQSQGGKHAPIGMGVGGPVESLEAAIAKKYYEGEEPTPAQQIAYKTALGVGGLAKGRSLGIVNPQWTKFDDWDQLISMGTELVGAATTGPKVVKSEFGRLVSEPAFGMAPSKVAADMAGKAARGFVDKVAEYIPMGDKAKFWMKTIISRATHGGTFMASMDVANKPKGEVPKDFLKGSIFSLLFTGTSLANFSKYPALNILAKQVGSRALGQVMGVYDPRAWKAITNGIIAKEPWAMEVANSLIDEYMFTAGNLQTLDPAKARETRKRIESDLKKFNEEYGYSLGFSPEAKQISDNMIEMRELALQPGAEGMIEGLRAQNAALMEARAKRVALVRVGAVNEVTREGQVIPGELTPKEIARRKNVMGQIAKVKEMQRAREYEKERQGMLPVPVTPGAQGTVVGPGGRVYPEEVMRQPEGQQLQRELIAERQGLAQQQAKGKAVERAQFEDLARRLEAVPEETVMQPKRPVAAAVKGKPVAAKAEVKIPEVAKPVPPAEAPPVAAKGEQVAVSEIQAQRQRWADILNDPKRLEAEAKKAGVPVDKYKATLQENLHKTVSVARAPEKPAAAPVEKARAVAPQPAKPAAPRKPGEFRIGDSVVWKKKNARVESVLKGGGVIKRADGGTVTVRPSEITLAGAPPKAAARPPMAKPVEKGPAKPEAKVPGIMAREPGPPEGKYRLRGNYLYKGNTVVFDLNVNAKPLVQEHRLYKRRLRAGQIDKGGYSKLRESVLQKAVDAYLAFKPWKTFRPPMEEKRIQEKRVEALRMGIERVTSPMKPNPKWEAEAKRVGAENVSKNIPKEIPNPKYMKAEQLPPFTEEVKAGVIPETPPIEKVPLSKVSQKKILRGGMAGLRELRKRKAQEPLVETGLADLLEQKLEAAKRSYTAAEQLTDIAELLKGTSVWVEPKKMPGRAKKTEGEMKGLTTRWIDPEDIKYMKPGEIDISAHGRGEASLEEFSRAGKRGVFGKRYVKWDERKRQATPGYYDAHSYRQDPWGALIQIDNKTNKIDWIERGENVPPSSEPLMRKQIQLKGLNLQQVTPDQAKRMIDEYRQKKLGITIPERTPTPAADVQSREFAKNAVEKRFRIGAPVIANFDRMGATLLSKAAKDFGYEQNSHVSTDHMNAKAAYRMLAADLIKSERLFHPIESSKRIGKMMLDLAEGKIEPQTNNQVVAKKIIRTILDDISTEATKLGLKVPTLFGERPFVPRENYYPQVWERKGLKMFLEETNPEFRHLRDKYIEKIAKKEYGELYKTDPAQALEQARDSWQRLRDDLKTKPFGNLERQRILDEAVLAELQADWARVYPDRPFPLVRETSPTVLFDYITGARTRLSWIRNFGNDVMLAPGKGYEPEKLFSLTRGIEKESNRRYVRDFFHDYLRHAGVDSRAVRIQRAIRTYQLWKLGTAWVPNTFQWFTNVVPNVSTRAAIEGLIDTSKYLSGNKEIRKFFGESGARIMGSTLREVLIEEPSKLKAASNIMMKAHLFTGTEFHNALEAALMGRRQAMHISEKLARRPDAWRAGQWERELRKMEISPEAIAKIKTGEPLEKGNPELLRAAFAMRKYTQFMSDAFNLPKSWSSPYARTLVQFKNFAYNQSRLMVKEPLGEAWRFMRTMGREGDLTKLAKAAVILPVAGALIHKMKEQTFKAVGVHFYEELLAGKSSPLKVLTWMANAGTFGLALDVISALKYGERGIVGVLGGPSISDIVNIVEAGTKTGVEIFKSIQYKSGDWLKQRGPAIRDYWLKFGERLTPDARIAIQGLFKDWRFAKSARNWTDVYKKATTKYKELYLMKGTDDAEIFWDAWMATQGTEYYEIFNKYPKKPTEKEIARWWEEKGKGAAESINLPGESEDKKQIGQFLW